MHFYVSLMMFLGVEGDRHHAACRSFNLSNIYKIIYKCISCRFRLEVYSEKVRKRGHLKKEVRLAWLMASNWGRGGLEALLEAIWGHFDSKIYSSEFMLQKYCHAVFHHSFLLLGADPRSFEKAKPAWQHSTLDKSARNPQRVVRLLRKNTGMWRTWGSSSVGLSFVCGLRRSWPWNAKNLRAARESFFFFLGGGGR